MNTFKVEYCKKGKPTSTQKFYSMHTTSYEDVLFSHTLNKLCLSTYQVDDWSLGLNENIFICRGSANSKLCTYNIHLFDMQNKMKLLAEYWVNIECIENDGLSDIFEQLYEIIPVQECKIQKRLKKQQPTEWIKKEKTSIQKFVILLDKFKSLKKLKEIMPKATYYRNLKICREKGYIQGNRLAKRVFVSKKIN